MVDGFVSKRENEYQAEVIKRLERRFPGCLVLKNDEQYMQGVPDLTILWGDRYAVLEVKRSAKEADRPQPNQEYYLERIADMGSFASFIYPEIENEVFDALQQAFATPR
jgi:hypothetical protein